MYVPKSPLQVSKESQSKYPEYVPLSDFKDAYVDFVSMAELTRPVQIELS